MKYYKRFTEKSDHTEWGGATYYFELDANNMPTRQLAVYENGRIIGYDQQNPTDEHGSLHAEPLFVDGTGEKEWSRHKISASAFNKAWQNPAALPTGRTADAKKAVRSAGLWLIILGALAIVITPIAEKLAYDADIKRDPDSYAYSVLVTAIVLDILMSIFYIWAGIKLRRTPEDKLAGARKLINVAIGVIVLTIIISLIGGNSGGLLVLWVLYTLARARTKILQSF